MKQNKTVFQIVVGVFFALMLIIGFVLFATYKPSSEKNKEFVGDVTIWGTMDENIVNLLLKDVRERDDRFKKVSYVEKSKVTYNQDILEALAAQQSPDLILLSNDDFLKNRNKIFTIPSENISKREYYNSYADAFSIYVSEGGVLGVPFVIDPMVMYYNKNMFSSNRVVLPPKYWEDFENPQGITTKIRVLDNGGNILKTAISFGESSNIKNFKEILYTLFFQFNNSIIKEGKNVYVSDSEGFGASSDIIKFYTQFSNQSNKITYSWNRSLINSEESFLSENLATYFGFSSEIKKIRLKNPNLNFDIAEIPSFKKSTKKTVYAKTWVMSIPKGSSNKGGALQVALKFASEDVQKILTEKIYLPPVRKNMLNESHDDLFMDIFYKEAVYAMSLLDPSPKEMNVLFSEYITNVSTGLRQPGDATRILSGEIENLLKRFSF